MITLFLTTFLCVSIWGDSTTDQERCQREADYMAANRIFEHTHKTIGRYEGIGWGRTDYPTTCEPQKWKGYQLTGDATAVTDDGITVRVRSWR